MDHQTVVPEKWSFPSRSVHLLDFLHGSRNVDEEAPYVIGQIVQGVVEEMCE